MMMYFWNQKGPRGHLEKGQSQKSKINKDFLTTGKEPQVEVKNK